MKNLKKHLLRVVLALCLVLSLGSSAFAMGWKADAPVSMGSSQTIGCGSRDFAERFLKGWCGLRDWGWRTETIELNPVEIGGVQYYYAETNALRVRFSVTWANGESASLSRSQVRNVPGTNLYYVADADAVALEGTLYGTTDMPFADFYFGELGNRSNPFSSAALAQYQRKNRTLSLYESEGYYDAVSSATTSKWKNYATTYTTEANEDGSGSILGLNDVAVAVDARLYVELMVMDAAGRTTQNGVIDLAKAIENLTSEAPAGAYKVLSADGTYSAYQNMTVETLSDATATIVTYPSTKWGDYCVTVTGLPDDVSCKTNVMTVILTTSDGKKYALQQGNNLFFKTGELAWAVTDDFTEPHGNTVKCEAHRSLQGKTITNITYVLADVSYSIDLELFCPLLIEDGTVTATLSANVATVDLSGLPEDYQLSAPVVKAGSGRNATTLVEGTDYIWDAENGTITLLTMQDSTTYTFSFTDESGLYGSIAASVTSGVSAVGEAVEVNGVTYYYFDLSEADTARVTWLDETTSLLTAADLTAIGDGICYVVDKDAEALSGTLYGTADLTFAEFYYGELGNASDEDATAGDALTLEKNAVLATYESEGYYDAVSSATTSKWSSYATTYTTEANEDGTGSILGLNDVAVAVDADLYVELSILNAAGKTTPNGAIDLALAIENLTAEAPETAYKVLYADGTYSAYQGMTVETLADATATITTDTVWGDYGISVEGLPDDVSCKTNVMTVVLTTSDGAKYALQQGNNLFFKTGELAWAVTEGFVEPHGNTVKSAAHASLVNKTITNITYVLADVSYSIDVNLYCVTLVDEDAISATLDGSVITVDLSGLPEGYVPSAPVVEDSSGRHGTVLTADTDYTWDAEAGTVTLLNMQAGLTYTVTFSDESGQYGVASASVTAPEAEEDTEVTE